MMWLLLLLLLGDGGGVINGFIITFYLKIYLFCRSKPSLKYTKQLETLEQLVESSLLKKSWVQLEIDIGAFSQKQSIMLHIYKLNGHCILVLVRTDGKTNLARIFTLLPSRIPLWARFEPTSLRS